MAKINIGTIPEVDFTSYETYLDYPHLFKSLNDDFTTTGIPLRDTTSGSVTKSYNTFDTLSMTYPRDGIHADQIQKDRYLLTDSDYRFTHQIFKITHVSYELDELVIEAEHIASTLNDATVPEAIQMPNATAQDVMNQVLNTMQPQKVFTFNSNVDKVCNVNIEKGQQAGSILINPDQEGDNPVNSVLGLFGGELQFDNWDIYHDEHLGHDTDIVITYGKNIKEFNHDVNTSNMWTGAVFTATYTPGQAVATETNVEWSTYCTEFPNVGTYTAGGSVDVYDSPVEGHQVIGQLVNGDKVALGFAVKNGDMTKDGKYQINTVNGDDWYPIEGGGWVDGRWISFDSTGDYLTSSITGDVTVQADNPYESSGAGSRVSMSGTAVVAYKPGGIIHAYKSPEIGNDHTRTGLTFKNGQVVHYDMVERNQNGDVWYRVGYREWLYGPHLSTSEEGAYRSYTNKGYGTIESGQQIYHWSKKKHKMVGTTKTTIVRASKGKGKKNHFRSKHKKVKVTAKKGKTIIDRTIVQGGVTYMHTKQGWVESSSIDYKPNGSVKPKSWGQIINQQIKDHSKVEIYKTPNSKDALNWSIPNGATSSAGSDFQVLGHEAKGGDGKTYIEVSYKGQTGWLMEDNISDKSSINSADDDYDEDSDDNSNASSNVDQSVKDVTVTVGPLYADGFGIDPNVDKVNSVDLSSNFKHDDQDLSGQQPDGSFVATQADIDQLTQLGQAYLIEHKYGQPEVQDTISYEEMSGINADWTQLGVYDYVTVYFPKYNIYEKEQVNTTVWDILNHHYTSISIGKIPETWQHLLLSKAQDKANGAVSSAVRSTKGWLNRFDDMMKSEGSDRKAKEEKMMQDLGMVHDLTIKNKNGLEKQEQIYLVDKKTFENKFTNIETTADGILNWVQSTGTGVIQAYPNWQQPQYLWANTDNGGQMRFSAAGLVFYDRDSNKLKAGLDSAGKLYADSISGVEVSAMTIDSCMINGPLQVGTPGGTMNVFIGTNNPGSSFNPDNGGNAIWILSSQYQSMFSSGQLAIGSGHGITRIRPATITVGNDSNPVLTSWNWSNYITTHSKAEIKSWVSSWIKHSISVKGTVYQIWEG